MKKKLIQFKNIVKSYEDGKVVLKGIDLDIYENEFVTLLGPSGCGKTTLLRILGGFLQADQGEVLFDGQEISKLPYVDAIFFDLTNKPPATFGWE